MNQVSILYHGDDGHIITKLVSWYLPKPQSFTHCSLYWNGWWVEVNYKGLQVVRGECTREILATQSVPITTTILDRFAGMRDLPKCHPLLFILCGLLHIPYFSCSGMVWWVITGKFAHITPDQLFNRLYAQSSTSTSRRLN